MHRKRRAFGPAAPAASLVMSLLLWGGVSSAATTKLSVLVPYYSVAISKSASGTRLVTFTRIVDSYQHAEEHATTAPELLVYEAKYTSHLVFHDAVFVSQDSIPPVNGRPAETITWSFSSYSSVEGPTKPLKADYLRSVAGEPYPAPVK